MFYLVKVGVVLIAEASSIVQYLSVLAEGVREKQHMQPRRGHSFFLLFSQACRTCSFYAPFPLPRGYFEKNISE